MEHQYGGSSRAGASLLSAFDVLEAIISMRPRRELMVLPMDVPRVVAASDGFGGPSSRVRRIPLSLPGRWRADPGSLCGHHPLAGL